MITENRKALLALVTMLGVSFAAFVAPRLMYQDHAAGVPDQALAMLKVAVAQGYTLPPGFMQVVEVGRGAAWRPSRQAVAMKQFD